MVATVSLEQKLSLPLLLVGGIFLVVTLAEPYWFSDPVPANHSVHMGLWKRCGENGTDACVSFREALDWILGPQVLECMSLSCALGSVALSFKMIFQKSRLLCFFAAFLANLSGWLGIAGAVVFEHKLRDHDKAWCFYLNVVADVLQITSGIILMLLFLRTRKHPYQTVD